MRILECFIPQFLLKIACFLIYFPAILSCVSDSPSGITFLDLGVDSLEVSFVKIRSWEHWTFISRAVISLLVFTQFFYVFFSASGDITPRSGFPLACWSLFSMLSCHSSLRACLFSLAAYQVSSLFRYFIVCCGVPK